MSSLDPTAILSRCRAAAGGLLLRGDRSSLLRLRRQLYHAQGKNPDFKNISFQLRGGEASALALVNLDRRLQELQEILS